MSEDFEIDIVIDPGPAAAGANVVESSLRKMQGQADELNLKIKRATGGNQFSPMATAARATASVTDMLGASLTRMGVAGVAAFAAKKVIDYADGFTNLQNRLSTVTDSSAELADVTDKLFQVANETRSSFTSTGQFYARLAANTKDLGLSQSDLLGITETLQKAFKVSGASAAESSAAMTQLAQGLASGTLRGDELNSVLEQAPIIGRAIADSMGIAYGSLRKVASEGGITADNVIDAVQNMQGEIDDKFAKTAPTFADVMTKLENQLVMFGGKIGPVLAPVAHAAGSLIDIAGDALSALGPVFDLIGAGMSAVQTLAEPFVAVFREAIELAGKLLGIVADVVDAVGGVRDALADTVGGKIANFDQMAKDVAKLRDSLAESVGEKLVAGLKASQVALDGMAYAMGNFAALSADARIKQIVSDFEALGEVRRDVDPAIDATEKFDAVTRALTQELRENKISVEAYGVELARLRGHLFDAEDGLKKAQDAFEKVTDAVTKNSKAVSDEGARAYEQLVANVRALVEEHHPAIAALREYNEANDLVTRGLARRLVTGQQALAIITAEDRALRGVAEAAAAAANSNQTLGGQSQSRFGDTPFDLAFTEGVENRRKAEAAYYDEQYAKQLRWMEAQDEMAQRAAESPWQKHLDDMAGANLELELMTRGFDTVTDSIVEMTQTGTLDFRKMVNSMIADLTRLAAQKAFASLLGGVAGGSAPVPWVGAPGSPQGFATGGSFMVGGDGGVDTTPVYFRATRGERVTVETPAQQRDGGGGGGGGGGSAGPLVQVHSDPEMFYAMLGSYRFEREVVRVVNKNSGAIRRAGR